MQKQQRKDRTIQLIVQELCKIEAPFHVAFDNEELASVLLNFVKEPTADSMILCLRSSALAKHISSKNELINVASSIARIVELYRINEQKILNQSGKRLADNSVYGIHHPEKNKESVKEELRKLMHEVNTANSAVFETRKMKYNAVRAFALNCNLLEFTEMEELEEGFLLR